MALRSNFQVSPLVNPRSQQYIVDLVHARPLMATGRMINMLRGKLQAAFVQALVDVQHDLLSFEERFKENLHLRIPFRA